MLSFRVAFLLVGVSMVSSATECPPAEYLAPLSCSCAENLHVNCRNIHTEKHLRLIMAACAGNQIEAFVITNATLDWLPDDLFNQIDTRQFVLNRSTLKSLANPDTGPNLFKGTDINTFILDHTSVEDEDLSPIRGLTELERVAIRGYSHLLHVRQLVRLLDATKLRSIILDEIPNLRWTKGALKPFEKLNLISLSGNKLEELSRDDLPESATDLENLWLRNNHLTGLPSDFLKEMDFLQTLDLSNNQLTTLEETTFYDFFGSIGLQGNPLKCDGKLDWFKERIRNKLLKPLFGQKITCDDGTVIS